MNLSYNSFTVIKKGINLIINNKRHYMAIFNIDEIGLYNSIGNIVAVTWQISVDSNFVILVDETVFNTVDIPVWHSELRKIDSDGFYDENSTLYIRVKVYAKNGSGEVFESDWYYPTRNDDTLNNIKLTVDGKVVSTVDISGEVPVYLW